MAQDLGSDAALAGRLGVPAEQLDRLRLCRRPAPEEDEAVERIALEFGLPAALVAEIAVGTGGCRP
jgi:hypothetical protein